MASTFQGPHEVLIWGFAFECNHDLEHRGTPVTCGECLCSCKGSLWQKKKCMWTACRECLGEGNAPPLELFGELCLSQHPEQNGESTGAVAPCCLLARQPWFWPCCGLKDTNLRRNLFIMWGIHAILDSIQWARWMICQIGPSHGWIRANLQYNSSAASDTKITFAGFYIQLSDDLEVSREKKSDL